mmetsp:Transcript_10907/g.19864  ORF Transcript_10907/g.19864 Transcript_10907/m.19864 type:complete len:488 (-) Transcript_10907:208-1671(-)
MKRKMNGKNDHEGGTLEPDESKINSVIEGECEGEGGILEPDESKTNSAIEGEREGEVEGEVEGEGEGGGVSATDSYEEECVICLEELSSQPWGRCTPCNHAFHKKCWWDWENAHNERIDRRQGTQPRDEGPKCCLCNTVNKQFVGGTGEPAHNPSPFVASEDPGGEGGGRFSNWFREVGEEASGFMEFLASDFRESGSFPFNRSTGRRANRNSNTDRRGRSNRAGSDSPNGSRRSSFVPPFFGSRNSTDRRSNASASPNRNGTAGTTPPFGIPPLFGNRTSTQRAWSSSYSGTNSNANPFNQISSGAQIITQHLVNSPHLNGRHGTVLQYQPGSARYLVQLESNLSSYIAGDSTTSVAIKPENLLQTGVKVKIHGLQSEPRLNGKEGTVCAYSKERNRYVVQVNSPLSLNSLLSPAREISIQPTNIRIGNGACVRLEGLQRTPQWNGKYGTIVGWVEDESGTAGSGRYEVRLSRQYAVRVKMENVRL